MARETLGEAPKGCSSCGHSCFAVENHCSGLYCANVLCKGLGKTEACMVDLI
jgi:hypothetical protein